MRSTLRPIWTLSAGHRLRYLAAVVALVAASVCLYLAPLVPQVTIDGVISPAAGDASPFVRQVVTLLGGREFLAGALWLPALLIVAFTALAGVFTYLRGRWSAVASESIAARLRERVYDHLQHLPCAYFDTAETGDLIQRCTSDVETVRKFLAQQVVEIGRAVVMLLVPLPLMLLIDVRMTIASLVLVPIIVVFAIVFFTVVKSIFKRTDEAEGRLTTTLQENLTGIRVVRAFARQAHEADKFRLRNDEHRRLDYRLYWIMAWYWSSSDLLCFAQRALVVGLGAYWLAVGELGVGAYYYFITAVTMFIWPVRMLGRILTELGKTLVALGRIGEVLDTPAESAADRPAPALDAVKLTGGIVFDGVSFSHREESPVLHEVSFEAAPGETIALIGPSGCGKSTIVNVLLRLYEHEEGTILLDGHDVRDLDRKALRGQVAAVLQEPFLYSKTLRDNIKFGRPDAAEEEMLEAAVSACIHESIVEFDEGYDALVGERGVTLSGGQRQRVALARALLQEPAILVLDDALSAVDTGTETMILDAIRRRRGRHTTLIIAHRLSTLMHADRIVVLERGRVRQVGGHETLLRQPGLYRRLWEMQTEQTLAAGTGGSS